MKVHRQAVGPRWGWTNTYVIGVDDLALIVDPGENARAWVEHTLSAGGYRSAGIWLTHGHMDHTWDAAPLAHALGCSVYLHPAGHHLLDQPEDGVPPSFPTHLMADHPHARPESLLAPPPSTRLGAATITTLPARGHTACSVAYLIESPEKKVLLIGDTLLGGWVPGRPIAPTGDATALDESLARLIARADSVDMILPGHGAPTRTGRRSDRSQ